MNAERPLRVATRGSGQALTQARVVADQLVAANHGLRAEMVIVETTGDRRTEVPLHAIGGQGVFVKEVQQAVLDGRADIAVHSAKDLQSMPSPGLSVGAWCARRDPRDALVGRSFDLLPKGAVVATGSVRRRAQLEALRPDITFTELRGNIRTRLEKIPADGAIVMAVAALQVLDLVDQIASTFSVDEMVPAVGQGVVAVEHRAGDDEVAKLVQAIDDSAARTAVEVERAFLAELGSGCSLPVGAHADGSTLRVFLGGEDGAVFRATEPLTGADADLTAAAELARRARREIEGR